VSGSGISWAVCKSAPRSRQITTPAPHHSLCHTKRELRRSDTAPELEQTAQQITSSSTSNLFLSVCPQATHFTFSTSGSAACYKHTHTDTDTPVSKQDHHRVIEALLWLPSKQPAEGINTGVQSVNIGIHSAWRKASDCTLWWRIIDTATLPAWGMPLISTNL